MSTVYWTSDTHFGHRNIIKYSNRPFATREEIVTDKIHPEHVAKMDEAMIANWNAIVGPDDTIYHLGDFSFHRDPEKSQRILDRLMGHKHLILGNHDGPEIPRLVGWESAQTYLERRVDGKFIVMFHYGIESFNKQHHGAIHLHGHSHGSLPGHRQRLDVGTDCWDYTPTTLPEILKRLATLAPRHPVDHHKDRER